MTNKCTKVRRDVKNGVKMLSIDVENVPVQGGGGGDVPPPKVGVMSGQHSAEPESRSKPDIHISCPKLAVAVPTVCFLFDHFKYNFIFSCFTDMSKRHIFF